MKYEKHVFICSNQKSAGKCCTEEVGKALVEAFKAALKECPSDKKIRVQRSGCLGNCSQGPSVMVYPEGVLYGKVKPTDIIDITKEHLQNNRIVERLLMPD